jgi:hypothetical protein
MHGRAARLYGVEPGRWARGTSACGASRGAGVLTLFVVVCRELLSRSIRAKFCSSQQVPGPRLAGCRLFRRTARCRAADGDGDTAGVGRCALFGGGRSWGCSNVRDRLRSRSLLPGDRRRIPRASCPGSSPRWARCCHRPQSKIAMGGPLRVDARPPDGCSPSHRRNAIPLGRRLAPLAWSILAGSVRSVCHAILATEYCGWAEGSCTGVPPDGRGSSVFGGIHSANVNLVASLGNDDHAITRRGCRAPGSE